MATDINTLMADTTCYQCRSPGEWPLLMLGLLKQIAEAADPMADTSVNHLLAEANCYRCLNPGQWPLLMLGLLKLIVEAGGTGGIGGTLCGTADPVDPPTNNCSIYYRQDTGAFWFWNGSAWVQFIA